MGQDTVGKRLSQIRDAKAKNRGPKAEDYIIILLQFSLSLHRKKEILNHCQKIPSLRLRIEFLSVVQRKRGGGDGNSISECVPISRSFLVLPVCVSEILRREKSREQWHQKAIGLRNNVNRIPLNESVYWQMG